MSNPGNAAGAAAAAVLIAIIRENFRKYLITCEYLQIDPCKVHDLDFIRARIETVRSHWTESEDVIQTKKLEKSLKWFEKNYNKLAKRGFRSLNFASKCEKLVKKGSLIIHEGTVNDIYVKCDLSKKNYDSYHKRRVTAKDKKRVLIVVGIIFLIVIFLAVFL